MAALGSVYAQEVIGAVDWLRQGACGEVSAKKTRLVATPKAGEMKLHHLDGRYPSFPFLWGLLTMPHIGSLRLEMPECRALSHIRLARKMATCAALWARGVESATRRAAILPQRLPDAGKAQPVTPKKATFRSVGRWFTTLGKCFTVVLCGRLLFNARNFLRNLRIFPRGFKTKSLFIRSCLLSMARSLVGLPLIRSRVVNSQTSRKFASRGNGSRTGFFSHLTPSDVQLFWSVDANLATNFSTRG